MSSTFVTVFVNLC